MTLMDNSIIYSGKLKFVRMVLYQEVLTWGVGPDRLPIQIESWVKVPNEMTSDVQTAVLEKKK